MLSGFNLTAFAPREDLASLEPVGAEPDDAAPADADPFDKELADAEPADAVPVDKDATGMLQPSGCQSLGSCRFSPDLLSEEDEYEEGKESCASPRPICVTPLPSTRMTPSFPAPTPLAAPVKRRPDSLSPPFVMLVEAFMASLAPMENRISSESRPAVVGP